jgi:hypothetical protein
LQFLIITHFWHPTLDLLMQLLIFLPLPVPLLIGCGTITDNFGTITDVISPFPSAHY